MACPLALSYYLKVNNIALPTTPSQDFFLEEYSTCFDANGVPKTDQEAAVLAAPEVITKVAGADGQTYDRVQPRQHPGCPVGDGTKPRYPIKIQKGFTAFLNTFANLCINKVTGEVVGYDSKTGAFRGASATQAPPKTYCNAECMVFQPGDKTCFDCVSLHAAESGCAPLPDAIPSTVTRAQLMDTCLQCQLCLAENPTPELAWNCLLGTSKSTYETKQTAWPEEVKLILLVVTFVLVGIWAWFILAQLRPLDQFVQARKDMVMKRQIIDPKPFV